MTRSSDGLAGRKKGRPSGKAGVPPSSGGGCHRDLLVGAVLTAAASGPAVGAVSATGAVAGVGGRARGRRRRPAPRRSATRAPAARDRRRGAAAARAGAATDGTPVAGPRPTARSCRRGRTRSTRRARPPARASDTPGGLGEAADGRGVERGGAGRAGRRRAAARATDRGGGQLGARHDELLLDRQHRRPSGRRASSGTGGPSSRRQVGRGARSSPASVSTTAAPHVAHRPVGRTAGHALQRAGRRPSRLGRHEARAPARLTAARAGRAGTRGAGRTVDDAVADAGDRQQRRQASTACRSTRADRPPCSAAERPPAPRPGRR